MVGGSLFCKGSRLLIICLLLVVLFGIFTSDTAGNNNNYNNVFTPDLFLKYVTNFIFSCIYGRFRLKNACVPRGGFTLVKVTKLVSNIVRTPLAKIFLVTRLANKCNLFLPLVVISIYTCLAVVIFRPRDVCSVHLTGDKRLVARRGSGTTLAVVDVRAIVRASFRIIHPSVSLTRVIGTVSGSNHGLFPIMSMHGRLVKLMVLGSVHGVVFHRRLCRGCQMRGFVIAPGTYVVAASSVRSIVSGFSGANS